ncbi:universal stress protein [Olleya aquimaris]|uniref:Nucleotide-binding universal stress UspA family protein n=1 Tax=Olleya aquimaris TaxID=639310 RepID=A0A327RDY9_9FLAO|nr:universal stress protein [Olleya aquimaris]RAJ12097.1 nucleotide-binding universal stress UspA family protein [Olleya aquimaris]
MKNNKYKILVLSDLKKSAESALKNAISLAKLVDGEVTLFHVKKPTEVVGRESQLSAMRSINQEHIDTNKTIESLINSITKDYDLNVDYKFTMGNLKNEVENFINQFQPDIIVLGKRNSKTLSFIGDNLIDVVLKNHDGVIMVASDKHPLQPNQEISIGLLNQEQSTPNIYFLDKLIHKTKQPLKSFKIVDNPITIKNTDTTSEKNTIVYVFEKGGDAIKNVSKYASKNKINLLCVNNSKYHTTNTSIKDIINNFNVSLLLAGDQKPVLNK